MQWSLKLFIYNNDENNITCIRFNCIEKHLFQGQENKTQILYCFVSFQRLKKLENFDPHNHTSIS